MNKVLICKYLIKYLQIKTLFKIFTKYNYIYNNKYYLNFYNIDIKNALYQNRNS